MKKILIFFLIFWQIVSVSTVNAAEVLVEWLTDPSEWVLVWWCSMVWNNNWTYITWDEIRWLRSVVDIYSSEYWSCAPVEAWETLWQYVKKSYFDKIITAFNCMNWLQAANNKYFTYNNITWLAWMPTWSVPMASLIAMSNSMCTAMQWLWWGLVDPSVGILVPGLIDPNL